MEKSEIKIEKSEVLRYLGHRGQELDGQTLQTLDECISETLRAIRPRFVYRLFDIRQSDAGMELISSDIMLRGESIKRHLCDCERCALMAATLGIEADSLISRSEHTSMTRAVILDACATDCIEKVCDIAEDEIKEAARREGFNTKFRFSAGYGDLPLEHQSEIIAALGASKQIGLTVTADNIMIPRKSVTAVIGFTKSDANHQSKCSVCENRENCEYRR